MKRQEYPCSLNPCSLSPCLKMKNKILKGGLILLLLAACTSGDIQNKEVDPCAQHTKLVGGTTYTSNNGGNTPLTGTSYGYEMWTEGGNNNKFIWYGANQGGGAAFRAEWNNPHDFLGRIGYFWNEGKQYTDYKNIYCAFNFTRSANGTAGGYSYIGIYGWSRDPMIEWYIVEDWFGEGIIGPATMGNEATKVGEFMVDDATYFIYQATRPAGSGNIDDSADPFPQFFSVRQTRRQCGTISITEHFKKWDSIDLKLGNNMYEAKFLIEAGGGIGWLDASYISFY